MKTLKESSNPVIEYKRVVMEIEHDKAKTPSNQEMLTKVSESLKVNPELLKIKHIYSHFGSSKSKIIAHRLGYSSLYSSNISFFVIVVITNYGNPILAYMYFNG